MTTSIEHAGNDRLLVKTCMKTLDDGVIDIESVWQIIRNPPALMHVDSCIRFFTVRVPLRYSDVPMEHVECAKQQCATILDAELQVIPTPPEVSDPDTFFLARVGKKMEVFLDPISAIYWAGDCDGIQKVDLEYAKYALKADDETVIESAKNATASVWEEIDFHLSLVDLGRHSSDHLGERDLGVDGIRSARRSRSV